MLGFLGEFDADGGGAGAGVGGDPNWAVVEHASAAVVEAVHGAELLALDVLVDERRLDSFAVRQEVLLKRAEAARADALLADEHLEVIGGADGQLGAAPALEAERAVAVGPEDRGEGGLGVELEVAVVGYLG
jgi:hypothetical protein